MFFVACGKNDEPDLPTIKTEDVSSIQYNQVTFNGSNISNGGINIVERGVCLSAAPNPTTSNLSEKDTTNVSNDFSVDLKDIGSNGTFYVRA